MKVPLGMALCVASVLILSGCHFNYILAPHDQPFVGPHEQADQEGIGRTYGLAVEDHLIWSSKGGLTWDAEKVSKKCITYLAQLGQWKLPFYQDQISSTLPAKIHTAKYIICLDPIVVVGPTTREVNYYAGDSLRFAPSDPVAHPEASGSPEARLPEYFFYGTHLYYQDNLRWFSPDMKAPPQPLERVSATRYRIVVPWGSIFLDRIGDELVVTGEGKHATD